MQGAKYRRKQEGATPCTRAQSAVTLSQSQVKINLDMGTSERLASRFALYAPRRVPNTGGRKQEGATPCTRVQSNAYPFMVPSVHHS
jgi:hypothetical protein